MNGGRLPGFIGWNESSVHFFTPFLSNLVSYESTVIDKLISNRPILAGELTSIGSVWAAIPVGEILLHMLKTSQDPTEIVHRPDGLPGKTHGFFADKITASKGALMISPFAV
jgi:hypothetical protein